MSVKVGDVSDGLLTVKIAGKLKKSELERAQASTLEVIREHGKVRILVIATGFLGWERQDDWNDVSFPAKVGKQIEKIAIVGERRWEDLVLAFMGKGFRPTAIEYFDTGELARARAWVGAKS